MSTHMLVATRSAIQTHQASCQIPPKPRVFSAQIPFALAVLLLTLAPGLLVFSELEP